ncbi:hypothetical protein [Streptomyces sp. CA2R106]
MSTTAPSSAWPVNKSGEVVERRSRYDVMMRIRGFSLDIQEWAHEDPF